MTRLRQLVRRMAVPRIAGVRRAIHQANEQDVSNAPWLFKAQNSWIAIFESRAQEGTASPSMTLFVHNYPKDVWTSPEHPRPDPSSTLGNEYHTPAPMLQHDTKASFSTPVPGSMDKTDARTGHLAASESQVTCSGSQQARTAKQHMSVKYLLSLNVKTASRTPPLDCNLAISRAGVGRLAIGCLVDAWPVAAVAARAYLEIASGRFRSIAA